MWDFYYCNHPQPQVLIHNRKFIIIIFLFYYYFLIFIVADDNKKKMWDDKRNYCHFIRITDDFHSNVNFFFGFSAIFLSARSTHCHLFIPHFNNHPYPVHLHPISSYGMFQRIIVKFQTEVRDKNNQHGIIIQNDHIVSTTMPQRIIIIIMTKPFSRTSNFYRTLLFLFFSIYIYTERDKHLFIKVTKIFLIFTSNNILHTHSRAM